MAEQHEYVYKNGCHRLCAAPGCQKPKWDKCHIELATPSGGVAQEGGPVHSKGSAVVQEQWERSKWSHDGNWRESLGDWAADLLTEYAAKYGPIDAAQPEPQPAGTEPDVEKIAHDALILEVRNMKAAILKLEAQLAVSIDALDAYASCCDGCTCGDGWDHGIAREALADIAKLGSK